MFFKAKHSIGHISGMVGPIDVKRKGGASVGYWVNYVTMTFDLTHDLDLVVSRSKFEIALFDMERKGCESDHSWPWLWPMGNHDPWWGGWMYHIVTGVTSDVGWQSYCFQPLTLASPVLHKLIDHPRRSLSIARYEYFIAACIYYTNCQIARICSTGWPSLCCSMWYKVAQLLLCTQVSSIGRGASWRWLSARLQYLQCVSNGDTAVLH